MAEAVILPGGKVKNDLNLSAITFYNKSGFVATFALKTKNYRHTFTKNYLNDASAPNLTAGYYDEQLFLQYLAQKVKPGDLVPFNLGNIADAVEGDMIKVSKLKSISPYDDFCKINSYTWQYNPQEKVLDDDGNIIIRSTTPTAVDIPLTPTAYQFFNKNIPLITSTDFKDNKEEAAYSLALIALEIHRINKDIFSLFSHSTELTQYIKSQNTEWATGTIFTLPTYEDILQYEESLENYYESAYQNQLLIYDAPQQVQLFWLGIILSSSGLAVLPIDLKLTMLKKIVEFMNVNYTEDQPYSPFRDLVSEAPALIVKIVSSVSDTPTHSDYFLNQLSSMQYVSQSSNITFFEKLYSNLSDNRIGRYTLGAINSSNVKKQFIQAIYNVWKISVYNPYYNSPSYSLPANSTTGVFQEAYFIANKATAYNQGNAPAVITYSSASSILISYSTNFTYQIANDKIKAFKVVTEKITDEHSSSYTTTTLCGTYSIYQPVSLIGYRRDPSIDMPALNCVPMFFLLYANDFKQQEAFDFGVLSIINLAITFAMFNPVTELGYLIELSELADVSSLAPSTVILNWQTVVGVARLVQFTAGSFSIIANYVSQNSNDPELRDLCASLDKFLALVALGSMGIEIVAQSALVIQALTITAQINELGNAVNLDRTVVQEVAYIGDIEELVTLMNDKLDGLPFVNNIKAKFASITADEDKLAFFNDFYFIDKNDIVWVEINRVYTGTIVEANGNITNVQKNLVDAWQNELNDLPQVTKDPKFLIAYQFVDENIYIINHALKGDVKFSRPVQTDRSLGNTKLEITGMHNQMELVTVPPYVEGKWNFKDNKYLENKLGYRKGKIERCMTAEDIDPQTGLRWRNNFEPPDRKYMKAKREITGFWPESYSPKRIKQEMAFAFKNKVPIKGSSTQFEGLASDGMSIIIQKDPYGKWSIYPNNDMIIP
jgi:hypothetical protein